MNSVSLIYGAPGCGKTTELINILNNELKSVQPDRIAFVSFTKKGSYEGRDRAITKFKYKQSDFKYFKTLHAIAFRDGHYSIHDMISKKDYRIFSHAMGMHFVGYYTEEFYNNDDKYLFLDYLIKNNIEIANKYLELIDTKLLKNIIYNYKRFKNEMHIVDFTDLIIEFIKRNKSLPIDVAIIDEAQDLTTLQWRMCEVAFRDAKRVYIAGDDDQAIYEWNGADVNYFLKLNGNKKILKTTYRLNKNILNFSKNIVKLITNRIEKNIHTTNNIGGVYFYNSIDEIKININESYYFLARNNCFLNKYETFLKKKAKIFYYKNKLSVDHNYIKAINVYESMRVTKSLYNKKEIDIYLKEHKKLNLKLPWYEVFNFNNDDIAYYKDLIKFKTDLKNINIQINTIHGVKGGEVDNVVLNLDVTRAVKNSYEINPDSELRVLYVGVTRAKKNLHIIYGNTKNNYNDYINFKEFNNECT